MCRKSICLILSIVVLVLSFGTSCEPSARADLIGYWKLDEASGTVAADSAGADNDGTLVGDQLEWRPADGRSGGALFCAGLPDAHVEFSTAGMSTTAGTIALWALAGRSAAGSDQIPLRSHDDSPVEQPHPTVHERRRESTGLGAG